MPLETSSNQWEKSEEVDAVTDRILDFLENNPDEAFNPREISDEILGTQWEVDEEQESVQVDGWKTIMAQVWLDHLVREKKIKARKVPKDQDHLPRDPEYILYYSYRVGGLGRTSSDEQPY